MIEAEAVGIVNDPNLAAEAVDVFLFVHGSNIVWAEAHTTEKAIRASRADKSRIFGKF